MPEVTSGYAAVNSLKLHYKRSGTGRLMLARAVAQSGTAEGERVHAAAALGPIQRIFRDAHAPAGHISFSFDAQASAWELVALGGEFASPTL